MPDAPDPRRPDTALSATSSDEPRDAEVDDDAQQLRRRAEALLDELLDTSHHTDEDAPARQTLVEVAHELRVYQIELEMQNEELRRAHLQLEVQHTKYFELFDLAPVGYLTISGQGIVDTANLTAARLLGIDRHMLAGRPFSACVFTADRDAYYLFARELQNAEALHTCELQLHRATADGEPEHFWALLEGSLQRDAGSGPFSVWMTFTDITERKRFEGELIRERELLARAEAIGHIGSWRIGLTSGVREWSGEATTILGFDPMLRGVDAFQALRAVVHPDETESFDAWVAKVSEALEPHGSDFRIVRPDGEIRWVSVRGTPEKDEYGHAVAVAGTLHDVTDAKHAEEERVAHLEEAANTDSLTGLHNRRGFNLLAEHAIAQAQRANQGVGLIFGDMDGLKAINDEFGHVAGDRALEDAASILTFSLRSADAIARISGDEFVVLTVGGDTESLHMLNERLQEGFDFFNTTNDRPYKLAMSSGTAWCEPGTGCMLETLLTNADAEMYREKARRGGAFGD
ncbi:MAG: diguanylate cyclase [Coriobacteriia bacterium]